MPLGRPSARSRPTPSSRAAGGRRSRAPCRRGRRRRGSSRGRCRSTACISRCPVHDPLAVVANSLGPRNSSSTDASASLICRNSGSLPSRPSSSAIQARVPTLPTPTTLRAKSTRSILLEQHATVVLERRRDTRGSASAASSRALLALVAGASVVDRHDQRRLVDDPAFAVDLWVSFENADMLSRVRALASVFCVRLTCRGAEPPPPARPASVSISSARTRRRGCPSPANSRIAVRYWRDGLEHDPLLVLDRGSRCRARRSACSPPAA